MKNPSTRRAPFLVGLAVTTLLAACGSDGGTGPVDGGSRPQLDLPELRTLALGLNEWGIQLDFEDNVQDPIFPAPADLYVYADDQVRLYGFSTVEDADAAIGSLSDDGRSVAGQPIPWTAPVHFYRDERLVVLHIGTSAGLEIALSDILGSPVAGDG